jgi:hypothetical protein
MHLFHTLLRYLRPPPRPELRVISLAEVRDELRLRVVTTELPRGYLA